MKKIQQENMKKIESYKKIQNAYEDDKET